MVPQVIIHVPEKRTASIRWMTIISPVFAIRRAPADRDTQACWMGPTLCNIVIQHFYHGWLYQIQGLFITFVPNTDVTNNSHGTIYQPLRSGRIWHKVNF